DSSVSEFNGLEGDGGRKLFLFLHRIKASIGYGGTSSPTDRATLQGPGLCCAETRCTTSYTNAKLSTATVIVHSILGMFQMISKKTRPPVTRFDFF
ncbi:hypothetical protein PC128_g25798, partial [Phytophthora cactorum]